VRVVSFFVPGNGAVSWTAPSDCMITGLTSSIDALLTLDPDGTWLAFVSSTNQSLEQNQILMHSDYSQLGQGHDMFQLSQLTFQLTKGQMVFVSAGSTTGVVQIFVEDMPSTVEQLLGLPR